MKQADFAPHLTRYLSHYLPVQRNLSSNTIKSYRDTFKLLLTYCRDVKGFRIDRLSINKLNKKCIEDFLEYLSTNRKYTETTYNQRLCAIHAFFDYLQMDTPEYMAICQDILKIPSKTTPDKPATYLTATNLEHILIAPDASTRKGRRHLTILVVLYDTAARVSELADVKVRDVRLDFPATITFHGKGDKIRSVPLMKQTVALLNDYFKENSINPKFHYDMPLFWGAHRQKLSRSGITYIVNKYTDMARCESTDLPERISPHTFRHTKAMHLVQANVNTVYIKDLLGHANLSTTECYAKADNETKREVLEKAASRYNLPKPSAWEEDAELITWLSNLGKS